MFALVLVASLFLALLVRVVLALCRKSHQDPKFGDPPSDRSYDTLGIIWICTTIYHFYHETALTNAVNLFHKHGETFASSILAQRVIFTNDPRNIKHMLGTQFDDFILSPSVRHLFRSITKQGILALDGPEWKIARAQYRNIFSRTRAIVDLNVLENQVQTLFRCIPLTARPFDLQAIFQNLTLDIASTFALGESFESLSPTQSDKKRRLVEAYLYVQKIILRDAFLGPAHTLLSKRDYHKACNEVHRHADAAIESMLEKKHHGSVSENAPGYGLLPLAAESTDDVSELRDIAVTILIASSDTTASLFSSTFWLLARDERVFQKLRADILGAIGQNPPTYDQLKRLTYVRYVLNEALRLYRPTSLISKDANKDTTLPYGGGADGTSSIFVKRGQTVFYYPWASHRSPKAFGEDSQDFRPERWEDLTAEALLGYIPFGSGPRACPGQQFALTVAAYVTVRIVQKFSRIQSHDSRDWMERIGVSLTNGNGVMVKLWRDPESST